MNARSLLTLLLLAACTTASDDDSGGDDAPPPPPCTVTHFGPNPVAQAMPLLAAPGFFPFDELTARFAQLNASDSLNYSTIDIDGDHKLDLVVTDWQADGTVGATKWVVYKNTGNAMAAPPIAWTLPNLGQTPGPHAHPFEELSGRLDSVTESISINHATIDLDGDDKPDLIIMHSTSDGNLGANRWHVYKNTGTGFAATPAVWTLPTLGAAGFEPLQELTMWLSSAGSNDNLSFTTVDLDGDRKPDLVVTYRPTDPGLGEQRWDVYKNTGTGFATTPLRFTLPSLGQAGSHALDRVAGSSSVFSEPLQYGTVDIDGDQKPDLVITSRGSDPAIGHYRWVVYKNTGTGFAAMPTAWTLPAIGAPDSIRPFQLFVDRNAQVTQSDIIDYATTDLDGDRKLDLVITWRASDPSISAKAWKLYKNTGTGFAPTASSFALPNVGAIAGAETFQDLDGRDAQVTTSDSLTYSTLDLDGDNKLDIVVTSRKSDATVGSVKWHVYRGACD